MKKPRIFLMSLMLLMSVPAHAGGGGGVPVPATELTQILNNLQLLASYLKHTTTVINQVKQIQHQIEQLKSIEVFSSGTWSDAIPVLANLQSAVNQGQAIAYSMSNIDTAFQAAYKGYVAPTNYTAEYTQWSTTTLDSIRGSMASTGLQSNAFATENATMTTLRGLSDNAVGQTQAIQAGNMISNEMIGQLQKLRQLQMAQIQAQNAYMANEVNKDAANQANLDEIFQEVTTVPGAETVYDGMF